MHLCWQRQSGSPLVQPTRGRPSFRTTPWCMMCTNTARKMLRNGAARNNRDCGQKSEATRLGSYMVVAVSEILCAWLKAVYICTKARFSRQPSESSPKGLQASCMLELLEVPLVVLCHLTAYKLGPSPEKDAVPVQGASQQRSRGGNGPSMYKKTPSDLPVSKLCFKAWHSAHLRTFA